MTDNANDTTNPADGDDGKRQDRSLMDLVTTPFYAWIGAGARTVDMLGEISERVRAEEQAREEKARQKAKEATGQFSEQSRQAFLKAVDAAQSAFNDAVQKAQAGGDRAFGVAYGVPDGVEKGLAQLQPDQLRAVADGYLEAANRIYAELAARGERVVGERVGDLRSRVGKPGSDDPDVIDGEVIEEGGAGRASAEDPADRLRAFPIPGFGTVGDVSDRLREAGEDLRRRSGADDGRERVQSLLRQAADVTEALLGTVRGDQPAGAEAPSADDLSAAASDRAAEKAAAAAEEAAAEEAATEADVAGPEATDEVGLEGDQDPADGERG